MYLARSLPTNPPLQHVFGQVQKFAHPAHPHTALTSQNSELGAEINRLKSEPKKKTQPQELQFKNQSHGNRFMPRQDGSSPQYGGNNQNVQQRRFNINPEWDLNQYGAPIRCRKCGVLGHMDQRCTGTDLRCHRCNQVGHIAPACPMSKNF